jgi:hypothetical protein
MKQESATETLRDPCQVSFVSYLAAIFAYLSEFHLGTLLDV